MPCTSRVYAKFIVECTSLEIKEEAWAGISVWEEHMKGLKSHDFESDQKGNEC